MVNDSLTDLRGLLVISGLFVGDASFCREAVNDDGTLESFKWIEEVEVEVVGFVVDYFFI